MLKDQSVVLAFDPEIDNPDLLRLTYQFVKMNTLSGSGVINELNIAEVNRCLEDAIRGLEKFNSISTKAIGWVEAFITSWRIPEGRL